MTDADLIRSCAREAKTQGATGIHPDGSDATEDLLNADKAADDDVLAAAQRLGWSAALDIYRGVFADVQILEQDLHVMIDKALETGESVEHEGWTIGPPVGGQVTVHIPHADLYCYDEEAERFTEDFLPGMATLLESHPRLRFLDASPGEDEECWTFVVRS